jgi:hypothetical protein
MKTLAVLLALADIAPDPLMTGGNALSAKSRGVPVEMAWEEVDLTPSAEKNAVRAVFGLRNTGSEAVEFEVGFPSYFEMPLQDFALEVDGKKELAEVKKVELGGPKKLFEYWMCWSMKFDKGQERKVEVRYWVKTAPGRSDLYHRELPKDLAAKINPLASGYVLRTGAGWAGRIGRAVVRLHYGAVKRGWIKELQPARGWAYDAKADVDTLTLTDFEPDEGSDISYRFSLCTERDEAQLLEKALKEKRLDPWAQQRLLQLVEGKENVLGLDEARRAARVRETLEWMVPPVGPAADQGKISRGAEKIVREAFRRLLKLYQDSGEAAKAKAVAKPFLAFLKVMLDRDAKWKGQRGFAGQEYAKLEAEVEAVRKIAE